MTDHLALVHSVDDLYRQVVSEADAWSAVRVTEWAGELFVEGSPDRETARLIRRVMRVGVKLGDFWRDPQGVVATDPGDWQTRVDLALGAPAWRPVLDLARIGLDRAPSPELFEEVKRRFRLVHNEFWMEGVDYEEWADVAGE